CQQAYSSPFTF
nr:immunoglobulin light chain junction region [Macaca mulatta]